MPRSSSSSSSSSSSPETMNVLDGPVTTKRSAFKDGAIVRIRCHQFLTYREVTIRPGPRLNVVVGPNGTGKSSIVCAIAIGLGAKTSLLGRSDYLGEFVMNGCDKGFVEIEIYRDGGDNAVIRRSMEADKASSVWALNGKRVQQKVIMDIVERTGAVLENLCTFLPQEKVGEFSGFNSQQLLVETSKAVGSETQYANHMKLKEMETELNDQTRQIESKKRKIADLMEQNSALERDKKKMEERKEHIQKVDMCRKKLLWSEFEELQGKTREAKECSDAAKADLANADSNLEPLKEAAFKAKTTVTKESKKFDNARHDLDAAKKELKGFQTKIETYTEKYSDYVSDFQNLEARVKEHAKKVESLEKQLENKKQSLKDFDRPALDAEVARLKQIKAELKAEFDKVDILRDEKQSEYDNLRGEVDGVQQRLKEMGNMEQKRLKAYGGYGNGYNNKYFMQALKVRNWLDSAGRGSFLRPVHGPIGLEVKLRDSQYETVVEGVIKSPAFLNSFVTECDEDYQTLRKSASKLAPSINIYNVEGGELRSSNPRISKIKQELNAAGVIHTLDELVECPDPVRETLRNHLRFDETMVSDLGGRLYEGMSSNSRPIEAKLLSMSNAATVIAFNPKNQSWVKFGIKKGRYTAAKDTVATVEAVRGSVTGWLRHNGSSADVSSDDEEAKLKVELEQLNSKLKLAQQAGQKEVNNAKNIKQKYQKVKDQCEKKIREANGEKKLQSEIASAEKKLEKVQNEGAIDVDKEKVQLRKRLKVAMKGRLDAMEAAQDALARVVDMTVAAGAINITLEMAKDLHQHWERAYEDEQHKLEDKKALANTLKAKFKEMKEKLKKVKKEAIEQANIHTGNKNDDGSDELNDLGNSLLEMFGPDTTRDQVIVMLEGAQAAADNITDNPAVIEQYNARKKHIATLEAEVTDIEAGGSAATEAFEALKNEWEEQVNGMADSLNNLFSEYMGALGNQGQVEIAKGPTFNTWGLRLLVSFRKGSAPVPLSRHVQSGGERSVSTIMFLMALQDMVRSPFRVVDEINQGMDERNERIVFKRIVENSVGPARPQYFLITPKLLQGLTAMEHEDVTVLFVFNGPYNISSDKWDLMKFLARAQSTEDGAVKKKRRISSGLTQGSVL